MATTTTSSSSSSSGDAKDASPLKGQGADRDFSRIYEYVTSSTDMRDTAATYDSWGGRKYNEDINETIYNGPIYAAEAVASVIPEERRGEARVLDVAAGTGQVGLELARRGFKNLEALDPSPAMLELLTATNVYSRTFNEYVGAGESTVPSDYYEAVVVSGGMVKGHIPLTGVEEFVRVCKPGGFVCIVMTKYYVDKGEYFEGLEPYFKSLEQRGLWTKVSRKEVPRYLFKTDGLVYIYKVL